MWQGTKMIWTCYEGPGACCGTTNNLNERGMKTSTLNTTRDNWASAQSTQHKCTDFLENMLCGSYRLGSFAAFKITNNKSWIQCWRDYYCTWRSTYLLEHIPLKHISIAKSSLQNVQYLSNSLEWKLIIVISVEKKWGRETFSSVVFSEKHSYSTKRTFL